MTIIEIIKKRSIWPLLLLAAQALSSCTYTCKGAITCRDYSQLEDLLVRQEATYPGTKTPHLNFDEGLFGYSLDEYTFFFQIKSKSPGPFLSSLYEDEAKWGFPLFDENKNGGYEHTAWHAILSDEDGCQLAIIFFPVEDEKWENAEFRWDGRDLKSGKTVFVRIDAQSDENFEEIKTEVFDRTIESLG